MSSLFLLYNDNEPLSPVANSGDYNDLVNKPTLGTAAALDVGTTALKVVQLTNDAKLPAVDGSLLTGIGSTASDITVDNTFRIQDNSDATKQIAFEASGITTGTTRTLTSPDASGTIALIDTTGLSDKDLFYYDSSSQLFKRIAIGTTDQALIAKPSLNPPYQFATPSSGGREVLTANRIYYVRTDGSDSNDGLTNTSGGAFQTAQKAIDVANGSIDNAGFDVIIIFASGTYSSSQILLKSLLSGGTLKLVGDTTTPSNCIINIINLNNFSPAIVAATNGNFEINGFAIQCTGGNLYTKGISSSIPGSIVTVKKINVDTTISRVFASNHGALLQLYDTVSLASGSYEFTLEAFNGRFVTGNSFTLVASGGTVNFTSANIYGTAASTFVLFALSSTGTFTGKKYNLNLNSTGYNFNFYTIPGNVSGTLSTGSQIS